MFGLKNTKKEASANVAAKNVSPREKAIAMEEKISTMPVGKTGSSRVESEFLCLESKDNEIESWRIFKIMAELVDGFELLRNYDLAATIYGSARHHFDEQVYKDAEMLAARLAGEGFAVITGGGDGIMGAANKGAKEAGGNSIGLNIQLPTEQQENEYTTDRKEFHYFFTRKVMLAFASEVYIFFPGGFGTLDELFEIMTLVQTKKIKRIPIILMGKTYWQPLITWIEEVLCKEGAVDDSDMQIYQLVDSVDEAMEVIKKRVIC